MLILLGKYPTIFMILTSLFTVISIAACFGGYIIYNSDPLLIRRRLIPAVFYCLTSGSAWLIITIQFKRDFCAKASVYRPTGSPSAFTDLLSLLFFIIICPVLFSIVIIWCMLLREWFCDDRSASSMLYISIKNILYGLPIPLKYLCILIDDDKAMLCYLYNLLYVVLGVILIDFSASILKRIFTRIE